MIESELRREIDRLNARIDAVQRETSARFFSLNMLVAQLVWGTAIALTVILAIVAAVQP